MREFHGPWIVSGKRTPFGTFNGSLRALSATDLAVEAARAALAQSSVPAEDIGQVIIGNVVQTSPDAIYLARHVGLRAGLPVSVGAYTVNRLCASGFQAFISGAEHLHSEDVSAVLVGGTESMSQAPFVVRGARTGIPLGRGALEDMLTTSLYDTYCKLPMGMTAERLAQQFAISQDAVDEYAVSSQQRWQAAQQAGRFADELFPMELRSGKKTSVFDCDEHPRPSTRREDLTKLPKVFDKDGVVHAAAASGIADGAAAAVLVNPRYAEKRGLKPLARLSAWATVGCDPSVMGIGPVPAIRALLERTGLALKDIDLFEVNEAFAPQYLAVEKELGLPRDRTNVNGGAIALGHPLGASGARLTIHLMYELRRRGARRGIASACIGGGQGTAVLIELVD